MKARSLGILIMVVLVAAASVAAADYTIQFPDGWTKVGGSAAPEHYMKNGVSFMLTIDRAPSTAKTPDAFVEYVKKQLAGAFKNTRFEPTKKITVNGREGRQLSYTGEVSGIAMQYEVVYIPKDGKYYTLTAGGMATAFDKVKADCRSIVESFKLK